MERGGLIGYQYGTAVPRLGAQERSGDGSFGPRIASFEPETGGTEHRFGINTMEDTSFGPSSTLADLSLEAESEIPQPQATSFRAGKTLLRGMGNGIQATANLYQHGSEDTSYPPRGKSLPVGKSLHMLADRVKNPRVMLAKSPKARKMAYDTILGAIQSTTIGIDLGMSMC